MVCARRYLSLEGDALARLVRLHPQVLAHNPATLRAHLDAVMHLLTGKP